MPRDHERKEQHVQAKGTELLVTPSRQKAWTLKEKGPTPLASFPSAEKVSLEVLWGSGKASTGAGSGHIRGTKLGRQAVASLGRMPSATARRLGSMPRDEGSQLFPPSAVQSKATEAPGNLLTVQTLSPGPGEPGSVGLGYSPEVYF